MPRLKSFAPWHYYIKCAYLIGALVSMELYCHYNNFYNLPISLLAGLHVALIGEVTDEIKVVAQSSKVAFGDQPKGAKFRFGPKFQPKNIADIFRPKAEMDVKRQFRPKVIISAERGYFGRNIYLQAINFGQNEVPKE